MAVPALWPWVRLPQLLPQRLVRHLDPREIMLPELNDDHGGQERGRVSGQVPSPSLPRMDCSGAFLSVLLIVFLMSSQGAE